MSVEVESGAYLECPRGMLVTGARSRVRISISRRGALNERHLWGRPRTFVFRPTEDETRARALETKRHSCALICPHIN